MSKDVDKYRRIMAELDRALAVGVGDGFWSARSIFAEMDQSFLNGWGICRVEEILGEKDVFVFKDRSALIMHTSAGYAISLAMIDHVPECLYLYPQHYFGRNVGRVPLKVRRYGLSRPIQNDIYDPNVRLEFREEFEFQPGDTLERNGHTDALDWEFRDACGFVLRLHSEPLGNYEWAFDRATGSPIGLTVVDSFSGQMTSVLQMLAAMNGSVDREFLEMGLASKHFNVRWETLKTISKIAPDLTRETVERLANDPHPTIRRAAEKTLLMNATR